MLSASGINNLFTRRKTAVFAHFFVKKPLTWGRACAILQVTCRPDGLFSCALARRSPAARLREATGRVRGQYYKEVPIRMAVGARVKVTLRCSECKERNYFTVKNKKNTPDRLEMKKFCPRCRKYTVHNETK